MVRLWQVILVSLFFCNIEWFSVYADMPRAKSLTHSSTKFNFRCSNYYVASHARSAKMRAEMDMGLICWTQPTALTTQPDPTQASRPGTVQHYRTVLRQKCPGHRFDHQGGSKFYFCKKSTMVHFYGSNQILSYYHSNFGGKLLKTGSS